MAKKNYEKGDEDKVRKPTMQNPTQVDTLTLLTHFSQNPRAYRTRGTHEES